MESKTSGEMRLLNKLSTLLFGLTLIACESEFIPPAIEGELDLSVEAHIEISNNAIPTYVVLTKSKAFFSELSIDEFNNLFVHGASVLINDGEKDVILPEFCLSDLPGEIQEQLTLEFGLDVEQANLEFCVYIDLLEQINKVNGRAYSLQIDVDDLSIDAQTTIPNFIPLDSLWFQDIPGEPVDSLLRLWSTIIDPSEEANFYRYFTGNIGEPLVIPFSSVAEDVFFDGQRFDFPINRAKSRSEDFDPDTFGFFNTGDTIVLKWCAIDKAHFDFWNTLEFGLNSQGPFSSYTRVKSNVNGALGIWGGYACQSYELIVKK